MGTRNLVKALKYKKQKPDWVFFASTSHVYKLNKKKIKKAVALEYGENPIPILTAKGDAEVAEAIIAEAEKQGVFIAEDKRLVSLLSQVELNEEIPENLYVSVAVILSWVYWLKGMRPEDNKDI